MRFRVALWLFFALVCLFGAGRVLAKGDIRKDSYDALAKVHKLIENGHYEEATTRLDAIGTAKASSYEQALLLQTRGHLHARQGRYRDAIAALKGCLALGALPKSVSQDARYLLIQMQAAAASWDDAAEGMDAWLASEKRPPAQAQALAGSIYAQVKRPEQAADRLRRAIDQSKEPSELWYRQLAAVYLGEGRYMVAATLLGDMVRRFPQRKDYWLQLSGTYQALGDYDKAAAVVELAYRRGLPFDEGDLRKLVNFLVRAGLPYRAGSLLEKALSTGTLPSSVENWQLLSKTWSQAREIPKGLDALGRALEIAPGADLQLRRAQLAAEIEDWVVAYEAAAAALSSGGLEQRGEAHLLRGIACYHLNRHTDALDAFEQARSFEPSRVQAEQWMEFFRGSLAMLGDGR